MGQTQILVVVDQPASIGALPVAVARSMNIQVAYLPGLAMRRIADLHPGNAKTDARDAYVIADAARTLPHALRRVDVGDDALADLEVIVGFDDDLAAETTRVTNRVHGLLTQIHPDQVRAMIADGTIAGGMIPKTETALKALVEDRLKLAGLDQRCASVRASGLGVLELESDPERAVKAIVEQSTRAVSDDHAEVICLGCGGMAELEEQVREATGVPIVDGVRAAVTIAEGLVRMGLSTSKIRTYAPPREKRITGWPFNR